MWRYLKTNNPDFSEETSDEDLESHRKFKKTDKERGGKKGPLLQ